jgi:hypothetical protein
MKFQLHSGLAEASMVPRICNAKEICYSERAMSRNSPQVLTVFHEVTEHSGWSWNCRKIGKGWKKHIIFFCCFAIAAKKKTH